MIKVLFICHGNICRSTMAQFVMQDMVNKLNMTHHGTIRKLNEVGVPVVDHRAQQLTRRDYDEWDYIIGMDQWNIKNINRIIGEDRENKVSMLLDYTDNPRDIADPWYTGNFDKTYDDIVEGLDAFLEYVLKREG